ncbi:ENOG [Hepatospora eriocheir]|uniref:phosphopyruvate hydratase n=1 Tax=Hepatospora eriocheir TaxID=1081669 RepID=A0A1X0QC63_9MICR|nr:ENOG [Hepatospora eriocheir]
MNNSINKILMRQVLNSNLEFIMELEFVFGNFTIKSRVGQVVDDFEEQELFNQIKKDVIIYINRDEMSIQLSIYEQIKRFDDFIKSLLNGKVSKNLTLALSMNYFKYLMKFKRFIKKDMKVFIVMIGDELCLSCKDISISFYKPVKDQILLGVKFYKKLNELLTEKNEKLYYSDLNTDKKKNLKLEKLTTIECLDMLNDVANQLNLNDLEVSLNVSANNFSKIINSEFIYSFDRYIFNTDELIDYYVNLIESYKGLIFSIKDPFNENDIRGWNKFFSLRKEIKIISGDLTKSDEKLIEKNKSLFDIVELKINDFSDISTLVKLQKSNIEYMLTVTEDSFFIDFLFNSEIDLFKLKQPSGETVNQYNKFLRKIK